MTTSAADALVVRYEVRTIDDVRVYRGTSETDARAAFDARVGIQSVALFRIEPLARSDSYVREEKLRRRVLPPWQQ